jgi:hypothetical protein
MRSLFLALAHSGKAPSASCLAPAGKPGALGPFRVPPRLPERDRWFSRGQGQAPSGGVERTSAARYRCNSRGSKSVTRPDGRDPGSRLCPHGALLQSKSDAGPGIARESPAANGVKSLNWRELGRQPGPPGWHRELTDPASWAVPHRGSVSFAHPFPATGRAIEGFQVRRTGITPRRAGFPAKWPVSPALALWPPILAPHLREKGRKLVGLLSAGSRWAG